MSPKIDRIPTFVRARLRARNVDLVPSGPKTALMPLPLATLGEYLPPSYMEGRSDFCVNLHNIVSHNGFSFHSDGWHPYRETLREYLQDPELPVERTSLHRFHRRSAPWNLQQSLLYDIDRPLAPLAWIPSHPRYRHPWALSTRLLSATLPTSILCPHSTPQAARTLALRREERKFRARHFLSLYHNIRTGGYDPAYYRDQPILGYFLFWNDSYRFVCTNGNHRLAILAELGVSSVAVRLLPRHPAIVPHDQLYRWTLPHGGIFDVEVAELLYRRMFESTGQGKAAHLGLL